MKIILRNLIVAMCMLFFYTSAIAQGIIVYTKDGSSIKFPYEQLDKIGTYNYDNETGTEGGEYVDANGHHYIDLGLPSGTLWATCNVGASSPEKYGSYFAWAEVQTKNNYEWSTYKWCSVSSNGNLNNLYKYNNSMIYGTSDSKTILESSDDAATVLWGEEWCTPTVEQFEELLNYCTCTFEKRNGIDGMLVCSKTNNKSIFFPKAGEKTQTTTSKVGTNGLYWSCNRVPQASDMASIMIIWAESVSSLQSYRYKGLSVRPVRKL